MTRWANETTTADEDRWAEAEALATGGGSGRSRGWRSPSRRLVVLVVVGVAVVAGVAAAVLGGGSDHTSSPEVSGWRQVVGTLLVVVGGGLMVVTAVRMWRSGTFGAAWSSPTRVLSLTQRRRVGRQLRGKAPVAPRELVVLRPAAEKFLVQLRNSRSSMLGLAVLSAGQAVQSSSAVLTGSSVVVLVVFVLVLVLVPRDVRRLRAFLDEHPAPGPGSGV